MLAFGLPVGAEWIVILVVVLIFFGAGKLPEVFAQAGKGIKAFKDASEGKPTGADDDEDEETPEERAERLRRRRKRAQQRKQIARDPEPDPDDLDDDEAEEDEGAAEQAPAREKVTVRAEKKRER